MLTITTLLTAAFALGIWVDRKIIGWQTVRLRNYIDLLKAERDQIIRY